VAFLIGRLHVLCGLVGAGKTTYARRLASELPAVRFGLDEWMLRLYELPYDDPGYAEHLEACTSLIWDTAQQVLELGRDVILDWNQWSRERRALWRARATAAGCELLLHHVDVPLETAVRQATSRRAVGSHALTAEAVRHFAGIFEPPTAGEGIEIVTVHTDEKRRPRL